MASVQKHIFLVAGEESANQYALKILKEFQGDKVSFSAMGFSSLERQGAKLVVDAATLSVMGGVEVLSKLKQFKEAYLKILEHLEKTQPQLVVLIDFGGFNLRLARKIKEAGLSCKVCYFITPKVWAWNQKRALKIKQCVDHVFVIHPFEVSFFKKWGVQAKFVGHPLVQELKENYFKAEWVKKRKKKLGLDPNKKALVVLLGSRKGEIQKHKEPFAKTAELLKLRHKDLEVFYVAPPSMSLKAYQALVETQSLVLQSSEPMELMALSDVALVASGTATLQVGLLGVPMAIGYIMNPVTMLLAKLFVGGVKYAGLVNILSEAEISKEFLQGDFQPKNVSNYLSQLLDSPNKYAKAQKELLDLKDRLGSVDTYKMLRDELKQIL